MEGRVDMVDDLQVAIEGEGSQRVAVANPAAVHDVRMQIKFSLLPFIRPH